MPSLSIATWNVRRPLQPGDPCFDAIARKLTLINADVWVLTETHLALSPGEGYQPFAAPALPPHPNRRSDERTTIVWVRADYPATAVPTFAHLHAPESPPRTALSYAVTSESTSPAACARVELPFGPLLVYGTTLPWPQDPGPYGDDPAREAGYAEVQLEAVHAHGEDWRRIHAEHPEAPLCIAGDLNTTLDGRRLPTVVCAEGLREALARVGVRHVTDA